MGYAPKGRRVDFGTGPEHHEVRKMCKFSAFLALPVFFPSVACRLPVPSTLHHKS